MAKKILIVDDEPDILTIAAFRLKKAGYEILTATDGKEAIRLIEEMMPDLILLDIRIPIISGYDVCKQIKSDERLKHIPIILFTASATPDISCRPGDLKADDYLIKPFDAEALMKKVKKFIK